MQARCRVITKPVSGLAYVTVSVLYFTRPEVLIDTFEINGQGFPQYVQECIYRCWNTGTKLVCSVTR